MVEVGKRVVGILGGMGPEATVLLLSRIIALTPAVDDQDHIPLLIDNNPQVPSRIKALIEKTGEDPTRVLCAMAKRLEANGAQALAMPCNTAHVYASAIGQSVNIPLLNMLELTAEHIARLAENAGDAPIRTVGMLASPAVRMTRIFDDALHARALRTCYPSDESPVFAAIRAIKAGRKEADIVDGLRLAAADLHAQGADVLLLACSELSTLKEELAENLSLLDSIDVLANAIIEFSSRLSA
jgi:aspartate racemase